MFTAVVNWLDRDGRRGKRGSEAAETHQPKMTLLSFFQAYLGIGLEKTNEPLLYFDPPPLSAE